MRDEGVEEQESDVMNDEEIYFGVEGRSRCLRREVDVRVVSMY